MKRSKFINFVSAILILTLCFSLPLLAQQTTQTVLSKGVAGIFSNDIGLARDQAIDDALRKAVEQTLGTFVQSSTLVENNLLVEDNILSWSNGYVRNHKVVNEGRAEAETYEVTVQADVELANLKNDWDGLQNLLNKMGNPRVM